MVAACVLSLTGTKALLNTTSHLNILSQLLQRVPKAKTKRVRDENESSDDYNSEGSDTEGSDDERAPDDEDDWQKFQEEAKKENALETKSKETHLVHCPFFPAVST